MYEGKRGKKGVQKPAWRCRKPGCDGVRSIRALKHFFVYIDRLGRHHARLELHRILELIRHWLFSTSTIEQVSFNLGVSKQTVVDWFHQCRQTLGKVLEFEPLFVGTEERSIEVDEAKIAGMAKYRKRRRLFDDLADTEQTNLELIEPEDNNEVDVQTENFVPFGEDQLDWA